MTGISHAGAIRDLPPPPGIPTADWACPPAMVRVVVQVLLAQVQTRQTLQTEVQMLQARVTELDAHLARHSGNSSRPPSRDPPSAPPRPPNAPSGHKRGGQPGHPGQHRELRPPDHVTALMGHRPTTCAHCQHRLSSDLPPSGLPLRQQVWELPDVQPIITEHQFVTVRWDTCQRAVRAARPAAVPPGSFGPHLAALVARLHGR